jgi:hypothetical protein
MKEPEVFVLADRTLNGAVMEIGEDQWDARVAAGGTLREVAASFAADDARVPDLLAGRTPSPPAGDPLGDNPYRAFSDTVDRACAAALAVDDLDRPVHTGSGDLPARAWFWMANTARGLAAHDIGRALGSDEELPDDLVRGMYEEVLEHGDELRAMGFLSEPQPVPGDAPMLVVLLAMCGRDPALI